MPDAPPSTTFDDSSTSYRFLLRLQALNGELPWVMKRP
jgi:hypothetical protein